MTKDIILNELIKLIRKRALEYQNTLKKEEINYTHYRKLLRELIDITDKIYLIEENTK